VLERNNKVIKADKKIWGTYFISTYLQADIVAFNEFQATIQKSIRNLDKSK